MADRLNIAAKPRTVTGKQVKRLRRDGWIPAVIYGQSDPVHIQLENLNLRRVLREAGTTHLINLDLGNSQRTVLARQVQVHPTRNELMHVDFYEVNMRQNITANATLTISGESVPEADGLGATVLILHSVEIECLPDDLISQIEVDVTQIATPDDAIYVRDLPVPAGVTVLTDPDAVAAKFEYTQLAEEEEEEEETFLEPAADTVEVISKGKKEEEEDEIED